jgi:chorismate mutase / prephenate dehydratase
MFYLDFEGNIEDSKVKEALDDLTRGVRFIKILGCYPSHDLARVTLPNSLVANNGALDEASGTPGVNKEIAKAEKKETAKPVKKAYKLASREYKAADTIIEVGGLQIGGSGFVVIAGPCSVESYDQIMLCAKEAKEHGTHILRGGCFKPRTSPYSFQGLGLKGLDMLVDAGKTYSMPVITEVMSEEDIIPVAAKADILQIGARNMQNFSLLKAIGRTHRPVMLKRGLSSTVEDLLLAVEYILSEGNQQVILCERGIRTFETATRNTLDLSAVPVLKRLTHLPIFVDPSHAAGDRDLVAPLALAAKAVGAHGIMIEFHPEPEKALSDGPQALRFPQFEELMSGLTR